MPEFSDVQLLFQFGEERMALVEAYPDTRFPRHQLILNTLVKCKWQRSARTAISERVTFSSGGNKDDLFGFSVGLPFS